MQAYPEKKSGKLFRFLPWKDNQSGSVANKVESAYSDNEMTYARRQWYVNPDSGKQENTAQHHSYKRIQKQMLRTGVVLMSG